MGAALLLALLGSRHAVAQQPPATPPATAQTPAAKPSGEWAALPRMVLERQFAGPLQDTVIQRLRDPVDGTICYLYLPISAPHSPPTGAGFVQYGSNVIGSVSCLPALRPTTAATTRKP
jgi:hypothetical protein